MAGITASQRCLSTGSSSYTRARLHNHRSSADVCVSGCWKEKKKKKLTSRRKVVERTSGRDDRSHVVHFRASPPPPEVSGCSVLPGLQS